MVSSTFYDLRQVRADLTAFINQSGYEPLLSELNTFPVDPDADTISNCRRRVEDSADVFVLVIGGRYGSVDRDSDKSVTNLEYLEARTKGIPIYAFVEKSVLSVLSVWKDNRSGDFSAVVDTPRVFAFVEQVRTLDKVWTFSFETASDIIGALREQLAFLLKDSLELRSLIKGSLLPDWYRGLWSQALRLVLERSNSWEYLLFTQVWMDEIDKRDGQWFDYENRIVSGFGETVGASIALDWIQARIKELSLYTDGANRVINEVAKDAFGPPGVSGDAYEIVLAARKLGEIYGAHLTWTAEVRRAYVAPTFDDIVAELIMFPDLVISRMRSFPKEANTALTNEIKKPESERGAVELTLTFELSNAEEYQKAMEAARRKLGLPSSNA
jgi:hypothetical protein